MAVMTGKVAGKERRERKGNELHEIEEKKGNREKLAIEESSSKSAEAPFKLK